MKPFAIVFSISLLAFLFSYCQAQTGNQGIQYTYDAAGNRILRSPATSSERRANPNDEKKEETSVVSKNDLQASFTPNPTFSGNFAVVVNSTAEAPMDNKVSADKPQIFIYNPLGELIHQESAQYNSLVNISLSGLAKGIYIVKVQSGGDVLMHRMAYQ